MAKRVFISILLGVVICCVTFYLGYFVALIVAALVGPLNPANTPGLQTWLRQLMMPVAVVVGLLAAVLSYRRLRDEAPVTKKRGNVLRFR